MQKIYNLPIFSSTTRANMHNWGDVYKLYDIDCQKMHLYAKRTVQLVRSFVHDGPL